MGSEGPSILALIAMHIALGGIVVAALVVMWLSDPERPDETVMLYGDGSGDAAKVEVARLSDC